MFGYEIRLAHRIFDKNRKPHAIDRRHTLIQNSPNLHGPFRWESRTPLRVLCKALGDFVERRTLSVRKEPRALPLHACLTKAVIMFHLIAGQL
jgi:hypothetical protein